MAQTSSTIKLIFDGSARGLVAAAGQAKAAISSLDDDNSRLNKSADAAGKGLLAVGKGMAVLGAANGAIQVVGGVAGALTQLAPVALALPGALLGGAAAMGTFKLATAGMGDALKAGLSGDMKKFAEATKDMAPEMQAAAKEVVAFKPAIDGLKKAVQSNFWGQFSGDITKLGHTYLPVMQLGLTGVSAKLGMMAKSALATANTPFFSGRVSSILADTTATLDGMTSSVGDLLGSLISVGAIGASYLPKLGTAIGRVTDGFREWTDSVEGQNKIRAMIDGAIKGFGDLAGIVKNVGSILGSVFTGLGGQISSPLAKIRELTGQVAAFLKTAEAQDGLRALGETLRVVGEVVGRVVMTALKELAPTLVKLAPVAQEVARTLGDLLVSALETLGPIIRGVADIFNAFPGSAGLATTAVVGFVAAIKTIKAVNAVTDLLGITRLFGDVTKAAGGAEAAGKGAGLAWGKGFTGGLGLVGAGIAGTIVLDKILPKDAAATHGSQAARDMLGEMAAVFSGEQGNIFRSWDVAKWISNPISMAVEVGSRELQKLFSTPPPPVPVHVDTQPASAEFNAWNDHVGDSIATANLDADPTRAMGTVSGWVGGVSRTRGTASLDADASRGNAVLGGWKGSASATVGTARLNADPGQANSARTGWQSAANGTVGTARLNANAGGANAALGGWRGSANATVGTAQLHANTSSATSAINSWRSWASGIVVTVRAVLQKIGFAQGGPVPGLADGGAIHGPGSGTSDSAGMFALSAGEWVMTAKQVQNGGGFAGMARLSAALEKGRPLGLAGGGSPMRASAQAAMRTPSASSSSSGGGRLQLVVAPGGDGALATVIMSMVRTGKIQLKAA